MISSKRDFIKFYLGIALVIFLSSFVMGLQFWVYLLDEKINRIIFFLIFSASFIYFIYALRKIILSAPKITISNEKLYMTDSEYLIKDIRSIQYLPDKEFVISFKNNSETIAIGKSYSNYSELILFLQKIRAQKAPKLFKNNTNKWSNPSPDIVRRFRRSQFLSLEGIYVVLAIFSLFMVWYINNFDFPPMKFIYFSIVVLSVVIFISYTFHFFELTNDSILIRNINLFWIKKDFKYVDILEIVFEGPNNRFDTNKLKVITRNYQVPKANAASLSSMNWKELEHELRNRGLKVSNYLGF